LFLYGKMKTTIKKVISTLFVNFRSTHYVLKSYEIREVKRTICDIKEYKYFLQPPSLYVFHPFFMFFLLLFYIFNPSIPHLHNHTPKVCIDEGFRFLCGVLYRTIYFRRIRRKKCFGLLGESLGLCA
jgi:hypothetical protein